MLALVELLFGLYERGTALVVSLGAEASLEDRVMLAEKHVTFVDVQQGKIMQVKPTGE